MTIEAGTAPEPNVLAVLLHSTESGDFMSVTRAELEAFCAAIKRGEADSFLGGAQSSFAAEGSRDWAHATPAFVPVRGYLIDGDLHHPADVVIVYDDADPAGQIPKARDRRTPGAIDVPPADPAVLASEPLDYEETREGLPPGSSQ